MTRKKGYQMPSEGDPAQQPYLGSFEMDPPNFRGREPDNGQCEELLISHDAGTGCSVGPIF